MSVSLQLCKHLWKLDKVELWFSKKSRNNAFNRSQVQSSVLPQARNARNSRDLLPVSFDSGACITGMQRFKFLNSAKEKSSIEIFLNKQIVLSTENQHIREKAGPEYILSETSCLGRRRAPDGGEHTDIEQLCAIAQAGPAATMKLSMTLSLVYSGWETIVVRRRFFLKHIYWLSHCCYASPKDGNNLSETGYVFHFLCYLLLVTHLNCNSSFKVCLHF